MSWINLLIVVLCSGKNRFVNYNRADYDGSQIPGEWYVYCCRYDIG